MRRNELANTVKEELADSTAFQMRKTFIYFCRQGVYHFTRQFFIDNFFESFLNLHRDKVPHVRIEFSKALIEVKPFLEHCGNDLSIRLVEAMISLRDDADNDVADATENTDYELLKIHKTAVAKFNIQEKELLVRQKLLQAREDKEIEERKKKQEEEEENKYDFGSFLLENRKTGLKNKTRINIKSRGVGAVGSNPSGGGKAGRQLAHQNNINSSDKTPTKRKTNMTKRNSSALPNCNQLEG